MDIVKRLRLDRPCISDVDCCGDICIEAADEIERLRWENANMEKLWGKSEGTWMEIRDKQDAEIEQLKTGNRLHLELAEIKEAEIERLREALRKIADEEKDCFPIQTARDALKEKE